MTTVPIPGSEPVRYDSTTRLMKLRFWLLRKLIGKTQIAYNLRINHDGAALTVDPNLPSLLEHCDIRGTDANTCVVMPIRMAPRQPPS